MTNSWRNLGAGKSITAKDEGYAKNNKHLAQSLATK